MKGKRRGIGAEQKVTGTRCGVSRARADSRWGGVTQKTQAQKT